MTAPAYDVVVPSIGRPELVRLLRSLARAEGPRPGRVVVVDDRRRPDGPIGRVGDWWHDPIEVVAGRAIGPAAARNDGWRSTSAEWIAFLDDDVEVAPDWCARLVDDLRRAGADVGGSQGRIIVPAPADRPPTDWERNVAGLQGALWATADMAYRRSALLAVGGFDERFPRAYREDADIARRTIAAGWRLVRGERHVVHPVRPARWSVSVTLQRGNADDALMRRLHGRAWRQRTGAPRGRLPLHVATTAAWGLALAGAAARRRTPALLGAATATALTGDLVAHRTAPGPGAPAEVAAMIATSLVLPPAAVAWRLWGEGRARWLAPRRRTQPSVAAVLFDRDGTLIHDVPYNGDPREVRPVEGARRALDRLRAAGIPVGVVSNQSGVARGLLSPDQVHAVNERAAELLGPFAVVTWCPHGPEDGCGCRKPQPGLVRAAAARLSVGCDEVAVVGDIGADVDAARAAGARGILVPTPTTRPEEVDAAPEVVRDLEAAVDRLLATDRSERRTAVGR